MKKHLHFALSLAAIGTLLFAGCLNKDLGVDVRQVGCKLFKIYAPTYEVLSDPSCTGSPLVASYDITFDYSGSEACLHRIVIESGTEVGDGAGNEISTATYAAELIDTSALVRIDSAAHRITFRFDITFQNAADADAFNDVLIVFHCENAEGEATNAAKVHIFGACSVPPLGDGKPDYTYNIRDDSIRVKLWDNASEDGDIVSIYLNGQWVLVQYRLTNAPRTFRWPINQGSNNDMVLVANNQGSSGPNTCSISINGRAALSLDLSLQTGTIIRLL